MARFIVLVISHGVVLAIGFALGTYFLPVLTAPPTPPSAMLSAQAQGALFKAEFTRELRGSDFLHWGEGEVSLTDSQIVHEGRLAPGPDYKAYLVDGFVEHENEFLQRKNEAQLVGDVKTFDGFILELAEGVDLTRFNTVVIWCEAFGEFISAAQYRD
ncbi:MAG: DM13 domain-containing protein [Pseudomonadaceae bacterium]|nr:DM13 domain-containing protein [Pseudomonadaceae bacterium]